MRAKHQTAKLAKSKLSLLGVARKRLGLDEDSWRSILLRYGGDSSARSIDERGFADVMDHLRSLGFTSTARSATFGERDGMASPGQVTKIRKLWAEAVDDPTPSALNSFLASRFKISALRFLPASKASGAITALKAMAARRAARVNAVQTAQDGV